MFKAIFYHLALFWLCLRLIIKLALFSFKIAFHKFVEKNYLLPVLIIICFSLLAFNLYLFKEKSTAKIIFQEIKMETLNIEKIELEKLTETEIDSRIEYYSELEKQGIKNLNLYLNLAVLYQENDQELASQYLKKAQKIDPNNPIFK